MHVLSSKASDVIGLGWDLGITIFKHPPPPSKRFQCIAWVDSPAPDPDKGGREKSDRIGGMVA